MFDTGAFRNYVKRELSDGQTVDDIGYHVFEGMHRVILANGEIATGERIRFREVKIKGRKATEPQFIVLDNLVEDTIIGVHMMQKLGIILDPARETIDLR